MSKNDKYLAKQKEHTRDLEQAADIMERQAGKDPSTPSYHDNHHNDQQQVHEQNPYYDQHPPPIYNPYQPHNEQPVVLYGEDSCCCRIL